MTESDGVARAKAMLAQPGVYRIGVREWVPVVEALLTQVDALLSEIDELERRHMEIRERLIKLHPLAAPVWPD